MAKILVNYIYNKSKDTYEILDQGRVYEALDIAVMETEDNIVEPLVVPIRDKMTVVDRARYEEINKKFKLTVVDEEGRVAEAENGTDVWLPKDTDISKLRYINGRLLMVEEEPKKEETEPKKEKKPSPRKKLN